MLGFCFERVAICLLKDLREIVNQFISPALHKTQNSIVEGINKGKTPFINFQGELSCN
jgi:hypothetical protein